MQCSICNAARTAPIDNAIIAFRSIQVRTPPRCESGDFFDLTVALSDFLSSRIPEA
jgi:hypothetical protein